MAETTGFIVVVNEPERADRLTETIAEFGRFSDAFSAPDWRAKRAELVLVSLDGNTVMAVGLAMRRQFVATQKYRIDFTNLVLIEPPLAIAELENALSPRLRSHFVRSASGGGGRIPPATWQQVWTGLGQRRPDLLPDLRRLEQLSADAPIRWYEAPSTLAEEKDTVAVALRIAGFRPDEVQAWSPRNQTAPYLTGLAQARLREDPIIAHDAQVFCDWKLLERYAVGAAVFARRDHRLTVLNVNRSPIERSVGVDLIYYHHRYESYVLVQYKRMTEEQDRMGRRWVYRPEATWEAERQRIKSFEQRFRATATPATTGAYRLNPGGFFLKLAEATTFEPLSTDMIAGMYFPFDYWEVVVSSPQVRGPKGGVSLTYDNTDRHLNNSDFIRLVQGGWIGTRALQTSALTEIIRAGLEEGRSVMLAAQTSDRTEHFG